MKRNLLAVIIPALLIAQTAQAAEIYNKDGNKLDFYGRVKALHYFSDDTGNDGDKTCEHDSNCHHKHVSVFYM